MHPPSIVARIVGPINAFGSKINPQRFPKNIFSGLSQSKCNKNKSTKLGNFWTN